MQVELLLKSRHLKRIDTGRLSLTPTTHFCPLYFSRPAFLSLPRLPQIREIFPEWKKCCSNDRTSRGAGGRSIKRVSVVLNLKEPLICSSVNCYQLLSWRPPKVLLPSWNITAATRMNPPRSPAPKQYVTKTTANYSTKHWGGTNGKRVSVVLKSR